VENLFTAHCIKKRDSIHIASAASLRRIQKANPAVATHAAAMGRKKQPNGYLGSARERRGTTYKRAPTMFYKAQKLKENCGVETTILMYNKDDMGTYHLYTTEPQELLIVLQRYVQVLQDNLHQCELSGISEIDKCRSGVKPGECYILDQGPFNASFRMRAEKSKTCTKGTKKRKSPGTSGKTVQNAKKPKISNNAQTTEQRSTMTAGMPHSNMANVPLSNIQVYEDVFSELIDMDDMDMGTCASMESPQVHVDVCVDTKQSLANTATETPQTKKRTNSLVELRVKQPNTVVNAVIMPKCRENIATTTSGDVLAKYNEGAPPHQNSNTPVPSKKTEEETDSEIQRMVREIQSSFDTSAASTNGTPPYLFRKENTHFFSRFVM